jgi:hypothetical protein
MSARVAITKTDELDILSGIWIMSCNDDNPIMTYRSISQRLDLDDSHDVKAIVRSRPELFRPGILNSRLNAWKDLMRSGKSRPNWIVEIRDQTAQREAIDSINRDDVFRNQFRVEDGAGKCPIEIIDWGLQHIDRLRKAAADERDEKWRVFSSFILPLVSLLVAGISVISTVWLQRISSSEATALKHYEVSFLPKQRAYSEFMMDFDSVIETIGDRNKHDFVMQMEKMNYAFYSFEPFLDEKGRAEIREQYSGFLAGCMKQMDTPKDAGSPAEDAFLHNVLQYKNKVRTVVYAHLFSSN